MSKLAYSLHSVRRQHVQPLDGRFVVHGVPGWLGEHQRIIDVHMQQRLQLRRPGLHLELHQYADDATTSYADARVLQRAHVRFICGGFTRVCSVQRRYLFHRRFEQYHVPA